MKYNRNLGERYSPLYFLNAVAAGALALSFYLYLTLMVTRNGLSIPTALSLFAMMKTDRWDRIILLVVGASGFLYFAYQYVQLLLWNIRHFKAWIKTEAGASYLDSSAIMALPLAAATSFNLLLLLMPIVIPYLWNIREYLMPLPFAALGYIAYHSLKLFFLPVLQELAAGNMLQRPPLTHILGILTFGLISLGFSSLSAYSQITATVSVGLFATIFFHLVATLLTLVFLFRHLKEMFANTNASELMPSLAALPVCLSVLSLGFFRIGLSMTRNFTRGGGSADTFLHFSIVLMLLLSLTGLIWYLAKKNGYYERCIKGKDFSLGLYMIVIAGVMLVTIAHFLLNEGMAQINMIDDFSIVYAILYLPVIGVQVLSIRLFSQTTHKLFPSQLRKAPVAKAG